LETSERRVIGALILLAAVTFLTIGFSTGQIEKIAELMRAIFEPAVAGLP
jgi:hypothetical protein